MNRAQRFFDDNSKLLQGKHQTQPLDYNLNLGLAQLAAQQQELSDAIARQSRAIQALAQLVQQRLPSR